MNIVQELIKLANNLDRRGLRKEADLLDKILKTAMFPGFPGYGTPEDTEEVKEFLKSKQISFQERGHNIIFEFKTSEGDNARVSLVGDEMAIFLNDKMIFLDPSDHVIRWSEPSDIMKYINKVKEGWKGEKSPWEREEEDEED